MTQMYLPAHQAWTFARLPNIINNFDIDPWTVLHVGAHHGEEVEIYRQCEFEFIRLVEPDPRNLEILHARYGDSPDVEIVAAACAATEGVATLHFAERSVWSGLQPHPTADGQTVEVTTVPLVDLLADANLLVVDTQGTELDLVKTVDLGTLDLVIIETSRRRDDTAALYLDVESYMQEQGWAVAEEWIHDRSGYTDVVFTRAR